MPIFSAPPPPGPTDRPSSSIATNILCSSSLKIILPIVVFLTACGIAPIREALAPSATPSPASPLAPYNAAIATAEAGASWKAQAVAHYERALAYAEIGDTERALADFNEAIRLDPGYIQAYHGRLRLLRQHGDLAALAADYQRLADLDPAHRADYLYARGSALYTLRELDGARQAFDQALAANPQYADALYERALIAMAQQRHNDALVDLKQALRLEPEAANLYYARGLVYTSQSDYQQARADFSRALEIEPDYAEALLGRAAAAFANGDQLTAQTDLDRLQLLDLDDALQASADRLRKQVAAAS